MNNEIIDSGLSKFNLGQSISTEVLDGGDVNDIYKVISSQGKAYVIKIINADSYFKFYHIQKDQLEFSLNFSEGISSEASAKGIPAVCAVSHMHHRFAEINNKIILIYPHIEGSVISEDMIEDGHVNAIAEVLADLHYVSYSNTLLEIANKRYELIKSIALKLLHEKIWQHSYDIFKKEPFEYLEKKIRIVSNATESINSILLKSIENDDDIIICHNDIRPKNILWVGSSPNIIDWEGAGYMPRMVDYLDTMISWCSINTMDGLNLDMNKYNLFKRKYHEVSIKSEITDDIINIVIIKWLSWLAFCLAKTRLTSDITSQSQLINYCLNYLIFIYDHYNELKKLP